VLAALHQPGEASDALAQKLAAAVLLVKQYNISGTPTLLAQGRYRIDNQSIADHEELLRLLDQLLPE
jgi:hypothetical protein